MPLIIEVESNVNPTAWGESYQTPSHSALLHVSYKSALVHDAKKTHLTLGF